MAERRPIFSTNGVEIGFIEDSTAFDLFERPRCSYDVVTGNLSDFTTGKLVGYVSSEKNFVVPSRIAAELFGQPRKADADLPLIAGLPKPVIVRRQRAHSSGRKRCRCHKHRGRF